MAKWKLTREKYGTEEFKFKEGDIATIGRAIHNTLSFRCLVISRKHCVIRFLSDKAVITDCNSANGIYVGPIRILPNSPYDVKNAEIIGIGWTEGNWTLNPISDDEKYMFKLTKEIDIKLKIEEKYAAQDTVLPVPVSSNLSLKRKSNVLDEIKKEVKEEKKSRIITMDDEVISLTDSDNEIQIKNDQDGLIENAYLGSINDKTHKEQLSDEIRSEIFFLEYEALNVNQEYLGFDDEPIKIDSDSDSESEQWYLRLSQNSPGKPFSKMGKTKPEENVSNSSYSQMDDDFAIDSVNQSDNRQCYMDNEEEFIEDIIKFPTPPEPEINESFEKQGSDIEEFAEDIIKLYDPEPIQSPEQETGPSDKDDIDGVKSPVANQIEISVETSKPVTAGEVKKTQMIEPLIHSPKGKNKHTNSRSKSSKSSSKHSKSMKHSSRKNISDSQKEERKKKLKEIATKEKDYEIQCINVSSSTSKPKTNIKITNTNRGAFLTNTDVVMKHVKGKDEQKKEKSHRRGVENSSMPVKVGEDTQSPEDRENEKNQLSKSESSKNIHKSSKSKKQEKHSNTTSVRDKSSKELESRVPLKSLKPTESETLNNKSSKVPNSEAPLMSPKMPKKKVRFSDANPVVHEFEIEPGNQMKKTSSIKKSLVDIKHMPVFSLEKIVLSKILKWNPVWFREQTVFGGLPPILGNDSKPATIFHAFASHHQYVQQVGDLLLMEIWECLSLGFMKNMEQGLSLEMRIGSLPPPPPKPATANERIYDSIYSFSVNISLPSHDAKKVPRVGEILVSEIGPEKSQRLFYVCNVRCLPSPPNNIHSFYSIGLQAAYSEKLDFLRLGEVLTSQILGYISKELNLFAAMEYLASSPLNNAILRPELYHFETKPAPPNSVSDKWIQTLNPSQQAAVTKSVAAALWNKPCIQMVQGPPGTGKSSVVCSIVMAYFYNEEQRRRHGRDKILICATSNAAVDGLVCRLLDLRQSLPREERFRMVRVGRAEAMAPRAREVSSQNLVTRDAATRLHAAQPAARPGLQEEISHLEAKINMWKTAAQGGKDAVRVAYCQGRVGELVRKLELVRAGGGLRGEEMGPGRLAAAERSIIEGADIVVTTLASTYNHKMRGLRRHVALCIVDEAGQAIEPEALLPLTLDVTRLTLIGDPQQLPGYICSQHARKYGLGESLFGRLLSSAEQWARNPVTLLDQQYRMHADIADYPSRAFYGGLVRSVQPPRPALRLLPYVLLAISSGDRGQGAGGGNEMEACGVARLAGALAGALRPRGLSLAVITPYHAHKELLKKNLRVLQPQSEAPVEVNTVDSFQGQERDVVVVSLARSHGVGFLTDAGRMNVMLTRARHALVVALNPHAMLKHDQWRTLIEDAQNRKLYRMLPKTMCRPVTAKQNERDDILKYISTN